LLSFSATSARRARASMPLAEGEIQVWLLPLDEAAVYPAGLNAEERERAQRYRCPRARGAFVQTRTALRSLLGRYLQRPPLAIRLAQGDQGKPQLDVGQGALEFNVSHSQGLALLAFSRAPVGVDLEWRQADLDWRELLPVCCHSAERDEFTQQTDSEGRDRLLHLWTAKEAYLKGRGEGLHLPLTDIRLEASAEGWQPEIERDWADNRRWRLRPLALPSGYFGCIATPLDEPLIRLQPL